MSQATPESRLAGAEDVGRNIVVVAHNIRSTHNVGSILRTCDGFGVNKVYFTGYTPYPKSDNDDRLPYLAEKINSQIHKTALGAEKSVKWQKAEISEIIKVLRDTGFAILGLEQQPESIPLNEYDSPVKVALILGEEVDGIPENITNLCDEFVEITMVGSKESFNVSVATGIALYQLRFGK